MSEIAAPAYQIRVHAKVAYSPAEWKNLRRRPSDGEPGLWSLHDGGHIIAVVFGDDLAREQSTAERMLGAYQMIDRAADAIEALLRDATDSVSREAAHRVLDEIRSLPHAG